MDESLKIMDELPKTLDDSPCIVNGFGFKYRG
jgi:hypothetical protein